MARRRCALQVCATCCLADKGQVWIFMGFPTYGAGPFEDAGIPTAVPC